MPAAATVTTTKVVWRDRKAWFALIVNGQMRIYRWQQERWTLDGAVEMPKGMPLPFLDEGMGSATLTGGVAPDFTAHVVGADTWWFTFVARVYDRWKVVPFDDQFRSRDPYTLAFGASHHLIEAVFDPCGCAGGPTTFQWYRFSGGRFMPTAPPGAASPCTRPALATADHSYVIPGDPITRLVTQRFTVRHFACGDGWALASDGRRVAIYEQNGPRWLHDYQPAGGIWLRDGVGTLKLVGTETDFALPRSLLVRLGRRIGVTFPPAPPQPRYPPPTPLTGWEGAQVTFSIQPGDLHQQVLAAGGPRPKVLRIVIIPATGGTNRVIRFRWRDGRWIKEPSG